VLVAEGEVALAVDQLREASELAQMQGSAAVESATRHDLACLGQPAEVADRLAELTGAVEGPLAGHRAAHAAALSARDGPGLDAATDAFEKTRALLLAAEAATEAAVVWRQSGDSRKAAAAERRAATLAGRCEGARTPALEVAPAARVALTARELEVARLAARGLSNKEIAARLFLSTRTVENNLHTTYEKLGVEGRGELAAVLDRY
jgi:DNA-binding CsgD family transcriptional regulator